VQRNGILNKVIADNKDQKEAANQAAEELRRIKEAEEEALSLALYDHLGFNKHNLLYAPEDTNLLQRLRKRRKMNNY